MKVFIVLGIFLATVSIGVEAKSEVVFGEKRVLTSAEMGTEKEVYISLPDSYENHHGRYPVMFLLDGYGYFQLADAVTDTLASSHLIESFIVVGITHQNRFEELKKPGAEKLLGFIENELKPYLKDHFRVADFSLLAGHSLGGSFTLSTWVANPNAFNAYIAISPVLNSEGTPAINEIEALLRNNAHLKTNLFLAKGDEQGDYQSNLVQLQKVLATHAVKNLQWKYQEYPSHNHGSVITTALADALVSIFNGRIMPEFKDLGAFNSIEHINNLGGYQPVVDYYQSFADKLGHDFGVPNIIYSRFIWTYKNAGQNDALLKLIENHGKGQSLIHHYLAESYWHGKDHDKGQKVLAVELMHNPQNSKAWIQLARIYMATKDHKKAVSSYEKAIKFADKSEMNSLAEKLREAKAAFQAKNN